MRFLQLWLSGNHAFLGPLNERVAANITSYTVRAGGPRVLDLRDQAKGSCI